MSTRAIHVYRHQTTDPEPVPMGLLLAQQTRGKEVFSFEYDADWLKRSGPHTLDPALQLFGGPQYPPADQTLFGLFTDTAPDRWGHTLMQRQEARLARAEGRPPRTLLESDYLLGVTDSLRMGALRLALEPDGPFLRADPTGGIPPLARLRVLEQAARTLEGDSSPDALDDDPLALLLAPGSSLGGARPKASVLDADGSLWIAKFPSRADAVDQGAWELVVHELAKRCGIITAPARGLKLSRHGTTFLTRRFDRTPTGGRIHFASAMTLTGRTDGDDATTGASYLELAECLLRHGAQADRDLHQLWKRVVFHICVSNTDDHLRNHGFLLTDEGWILSPAYDMNAEALGTGLSLNVNEHDNALSLDLAVEAATYFRVAAEDARKEADQMARLVEKDWRSIAVGQGISRDEQERMAGAFRWKV